AGNHVALTATIVCLVTMLLLLRRIESIGKFSILLWAGVLATLAIVIGAGLPHLRLDAFAFWRAPRLDGGIGYTGLGVALIYAVYDYLGYYNICYIGDEVRQPERTIPRVTETFSASLPSCTQRRPIRTCQFSSLDAWPRPSAPSR